MLLTSVSPRTPSLRGKVYPKYTRFTCATHPHLKVGFTNAAGRGLSGKRTVLSKGRWAAKRVYYKTIEMAHQVKAMGTIISITPAHRQDKAVALLKTALGEWTYLPATNNMQPLQYFYHTPADTKLTYQINPPRHWLWKLNALPNNSKVCWVAPRTDTTPIYALAAGSTCILVSAKIWEVWSLVRLPSGNIKLFVNEISALVGSLAPSFKKFLTFKKSTKYSMHGKKATVRGTVKNPNDHPHGGRTRAIKYARTPWGRGAKKSRHPNAHIKLRPLTKRKKKQKSITTKALTLLPDTSVLNLAEEQSGVETDAL